MTWWQDLDDLLRGKRTEPELLARGTDHLRLSPHLGLLVALGAAYGLFMGLYAVLDHSTPHYQQLLASAVKVPLLFLLTLFVTFPSLYVFSALRGVKLPPASALRIVVAALVVTLAVLASVGPILGFFTLTTSSYPFIKLLNVAFFVVAGAIGVSFLLRALCRIEDAESATPLDAPAAKIPGQPAPSAADMQAEDRQAILERLGGRSLSSLARMEEEASGHTIFRVWLVLFIVVGAQMAWILRPFIGKPDGDFNWFLPRESNAFMDLMRTLGDLFRG